MKILLNVAREMFDTTEWHECQGVRFEERDDGSFDLMLAKDLSAAKKAEADRDEALRRMEALLPKEEAA